MLLTIAPEMGWVNPFNTSVPTSSDQNALLLSGYITPSGIGTGASMVMNALDVQTDTGTPTLFSGG